MFAYSLRSNGVASKTAIKKATPQGLGLIMPKKLPKENLSVKANHLTSDHLQTTVYSNGSKSRKIEAA